MRAYTAQFKNHRYTAFKQSVDWTFPDVTRPAAHILGSVSASGVRPGSQSRGTTRGRGHRSTLMSGTRVTGDTGGSERFSQSRPKTTFTKCMFYISIRRSTTYLTSLCLLIFLSQCSILLLRLIQFTLVSLQLFSS